ncbi:MAG TPA: TIGR03067 domain-containing protein [Gemmataceae bacterium]|nr:TIGR03067 domain-containing protein [Gemmataceae bacterium]
MRLCPSAFVILLTALPRITAAEPAAPLTPAEAAKKVNEQVTVQMDVKAASGRDRYCFLNSENNFRDPKTFTVYINRDALKKFKDAEITDPAGHFKGKTVQVTGKVVLYNNRPEIVVSGPEAIKIVGEPAKDTKDNLDGEWSMVSGTADGMAMPDQMVKTGKRVAKDGETTITIGGRTYFKAKFTIDPGKKPAAIDYEMTEGPTKGKKQLGIYKLDGDTVTFCFAAPGKVRPTDFTAKSGSERTLSVWKREKKK